MGTSLGLMETLKNLKKESDVRLQEERVRNYVLQKILEGKQPCEIDFSGMFGIYPNELFYENRDAPFLQKTKNFLETLGVQVSEQSRAHDAHGEIKGVYLCWIVSVP